MALTKLAKINENSFWAIWKIEEPLVELVTLLSPSIDEFNTMEATVHHPKKKLEWVAGRLALKSLLGHLQIPDWKIVKDDHGKPYLVDQNIHISLANSFPYATAIIHRSQTVGIDIEYPSEKLIRVRHKFLCEEECQKAGTNLNILCVFWCAKESVYKIHGRKMLSFKEHIFIKDFNLPSGKLLAQVSSPFHQAFHQLLIEQLDHYYIVYNA